MAGFNQDPEFHAALDALRERWEACWPFEEELIGPVVIRPLTPLTLQRLNAAGNPFVCGTLNDTPAEQLPAAVMQFLWCCSPAYRPSALRLQWFKWRHRKLDALALAVAITRYLDRIFYEPPGSAKKELPIAADIAGLVDLFAHEYGWTRSEILHAPMEQLLQLRNHIRRRVEKSPGFYRPELDQYLDRQREELQAQIDAEKTKNEEPRTKHALN